MYNAHFNFREAPFGVTPDPQFYYSNAVYREALATLCYGIEARKGFIVVAGETGTGKTTLLRKAMRSFESNIKVAYVCNTLLSFTELLRLILQDLGLPVSTENKAAMIGQLNQYLIEQLSAGNIVALLIDEAQDLSPEVLEELRLLGNLETDKDKLLQIVFIGQPELEGKLDQASLRQLKQRVALRCRLHPIAADEVGAYIDSRLQTIGHRCADLFDPDAVKKIAVSSKGIPRLINMICDNALLIAYAMSEFKVGPTMIEEVTDDLLVDGARAEKDVSAQPPVKPEHEIAGFPTALPLKNDLTMTEESDLTDSGDFAATMSGPARAFRNDQRWATGALLTVVMLTVVGAMVYSQKGIPVVVDLPHNNKTLVESSREEIKYTKLATAVLEEKTSGASQQTKLPAPLSAKAVDKNNGAKKSAPAAAALIPVADRKVVKTPLGTNGAIHTVATNLTLQKIVAGPNLGNDGQSENIVPRVDNKETSPDTGDFNVVAASFVRGKPTSNADIIATLRPGSHVNVSGRTGDYYRVRTLGQRTIDGYVHREDAFFQKSK